MAGLGPQLTNEQQTAANAATNASGVSTQAPGETSPHVSFRAAVEATAQREADRLASLQQQATGATPAAPSDGTETPGTTELSAAQHQAVQSAVGEMTPEQFDTWARQQPEGALKQAAQFYYNQFAQGIRQQLGDVLTLGDMAVADPSIKKKLARLATDKNAQDFIFGKAFEIMDPDEFGAPRQPAPGMATPPPLSRDDVAATVQATLEQDRARIAYQAERGRELEALVREIPALNWTDPRFGNKAATKVQHLIDIAEKRSIASNTRVSYRQIADELGIVEQAVPPQAVPQTSSSQTPPPASVQAPRNEIEARRAMTDTLERHGGLLGLAAALPRR